MTDKQQPSETNMIGGIHVHGDEEARGLLFEALAKAQANYKKPQESGANPHLKKRYRNTDDVFEAALPALNKESICVLQPPSPSSDPSKRIALTTIIGHKDGAYISLTAESAMRDNPKLHRAQVEGQHYTYLARYAFSKALCVGIAGEDIDDVEQTPAAAAASKDLPGMQQPQDTPPPKPSDAKGGSKRTAEYLALVKGFREAEDPEAIEELTHRASMLSKNIPAEDLAHLRKVAKEARERVATP